MNVANAKPGRAFGIVLISFIFFTSCLSASYYSTRAILPRAPLQFTESEVKVTVNESCRSGWCQELSIRFENLSSTRVTLLDSEFRLQRAGTVLAVAPKDPTQKSLKGKVLEPKQIWESEFVLTSLAPPFIPFEYPHVTQVVCAVKGGEFCPKPAMAANECMGHAKAYYESYTATSAWPQFIFPFQISNQKKQALSPRPGFLGAAPELRLKMDPEAPSYTMNDDTEAVFFRVECTQGCQCKEVGKRRQLFADDILRPIRTK